jgi:hypothetical protein
MSESSRETFPGERAFNVWRLAFGVWRLAFGAKNTELGAESERTHVTEKPAGFMVCTPRALGLGGTFSRCSLRLPLRELQAS